MRTSTILALASSLLCVDASLNFLEKRDGTPPKVVQHQVRRRLIDNPVEHDRRRRLRRRGTISSSLENEETLYLMNVTIGTPAQDLELHIDTGSSDLWVNVPTSELCSTEDCSTGTFARKKSSTYTYVNSDFNITYVDGSGASGDYGKDTVRFGGATLKQQRFGLGLKSTTKQGILGIGYILDEASVEDDETYANVPQSLVDDGYINRNAYSLWLDDLDSSTGTILFGGVNTDKFTGELHTLPIIPEDGYYIDFIIAMTGVGADGTAGSIASDIAEPALLDSGTSLIYLPDAIVESIYNSLDAEYDSEEGVAIVDCSLADETGSIDITFSKPTIKVPLSELVLVLGEENGQDICVLGISPAEGSTPILGDTFLRSAYVVYDLDNNEISLAQASYSSTSNNILEITNSTGVPDSTVVADPVTSVALSASIVASSIGSISTGASGSGTSSSKSGSPTGAPQIGAALLGVAGAAALLAL